MLARFLIIWHAAEVMLWSALAAWLVSTGGWSWIAAFAAVLVLGFFGVRLVLNTLSFVIATASSPGRPVSMGIRPLRAIAMVLRESWAFTVAFGWYQLCPARFGREQSPATDFATAANAPIVLLAHGYACNGGVWAHYVRWFEASGYRVFTLSQEPIFGELDQIARALQSRIEEIAAAFPDVPINLVCHSMGGLVARAYVRRCGRARLGRIVTLGTPHRGTALAVIGLGGNARQMHPDSAWMTDAANRPDLGDALAIFSYDDNLVSPREHAALPTMRTASYSGIGHLSLTTSRTVFERVVDALDGHPRGATSECRA